MLKYLGSHLIIEWPYRSIITNIFRSVNIHIRKINSIRRYLSNTAMRTLVQSIVIARLDYCNSVCVGLPMKQTTSASTRTEQCSTCYKPDQTIYIDNAYPKWATLAADQQTVSVQNTAFNFQIVDWLCPVIYVWHAQHLHA